MHVLPAKLPMQLPVIASASDEAISGGVIAMQELEIASVVHCVHSLARQGVEGRKARFPNRNDAAVEGDKVAEQ